MPIIGELDGGTHGVLDRKSIIMNVKIHYGKAFGFRFWLCCRLFRLGAWILGMGIKINDKDKPQ